MPSVFVNLLPTVRRSDLYGEANTTILQIFILMSEKLQTLLNVMYSGGCIHSAGSVSDIIKRIYIVPDRRLSNRRTNTSYVSCSHFM
jgi:hypothetical protein